MFASMLPYLRCAIPIGFVVLVALAYVFVQRMIRGMIICRPIPINGFPSVEDEIRYVNDEPLEMRRHWRYKSYVIFAIILSIGTPLVYLLSVLLIKGKG